MNLIRIGTLSAVAAAVAAFSACSTLPPANALLDEARTSYRAASADGQSQVLAAAELKQAGDALAAAEAAFTRKDDKRQVDHLAYVARQRVALVRETAARKAAEAAVTQAGVDRDRLRLDARTREADRATQTAAVATSNAAASQRQAEASQQQSAAAMQAAGRFAATGRGLATAGRRCRAAQSGARGPVARDERPEDAARHGDHHGRRAVRQRAGATQAGGPAGHQRLGGFLKERPQRKAMIEGYTDSVGSTNNNMALSGRRADAVMTALLAQGVSRGQLAAQGYGEAHPVGGNDNDSGRQQNRRVEIVLSDEQGVLTPR
jgi:hypothetical protein